jgi:hypothetical protein
LRMRGLALAEQRKLGTMNLNAVAPLEIVTG